MRKRLTITAEIQEADRLAKQIVADAGLLVPVGETPTAYQAGIAAVHSREDAAANMALITFVLNRLQRLQWWMFLNTALLVALLISLW